MLKAILGFFAQRKNDVIRLTSLIVVGIIIYRWVKGMVLKAGTEKAKEQIGQNRMAIVELLATQMKDDISGIVVNPWRRNNRAWQDVATLNDNELTYLNHVWNIRYKAIIKKSLYKAVKGELVGNVGQFQKIIVAKLERLNLN